MRLYTIVYFLILIYCTGCSESGAHGIGNRGSIHIDPARWYQLNTGQHSLTQLFNGNEYEKITAAHGALLSNYEAWYPLLDGEQMTIDSIRMYDWQGTNEQHPTTLYAVLANWQRVPIATFTGSQYEKWVGPDPKQPGKFALDKPVSDVRYLVINTWGDLPGELEFYGPYTAPKALTPAQPKPAPLSGFFGINAFEWDFEAPTNPMQLDAARLEPIKSFTAVRHYMDWEKLEAAEHAYAFAPTYNGGWNYDAMYEWCKAQQIDVLACLKTIPSWMAATYPANDRDNECVPVRYGKDLADPGSYVEQAKVAFQFTARYGSRSVSTNLLTVGNGNVPRTGLGLIRYIECDNERDKWWKGRKAYQTAREYAANLSAFYDGHKGKMGPSIGVKTADPAMQVVMGGLASTTTGYLQGMIDWCKEHRGYKADGTVDCPWDVINYHFYAHDAVLDPARNQTVGMAPEDAKADSFAKEYIQLAHRYLGDMPVWVTEAGYDINAGSPQRAPSAKVQADWIMRTSLAYARAGVQKVFFYQLYDDNEGNATRYATSGLVNKDHTNRPAASYLRQAARLWGNYAYKETINTAPAVDVYTYNGKNVYVLTSASDKATTYTLNIPNSEAAWIYTPQVTGSAMKEERVKMTGGKVNISVTGTPIFVTGSKAEETTRRMVAR